MITPFDRPPEEPWQAIDTLDTSTLATTNCPANQINITIYQRGAQQCFGWKATIQRAVIYSKEGEYEESREIAEFIARAVVGYYMQNQRMPDTMEYTTEKGQPPRLEYLGPYRPQKKLTLHQHIVIQDENPKKERKPRQRKT